jgi:MFS family permease
LPASSAIDSNASKNAGAPGGKPHEPVTLYHWLVFALAACGWLFDCMGQRIFVLGREPAFRELLGATATDADVLRWGTIATFTLMIGWATGGILFGIMSDRYGRVKAMLTTLLAYTVFSGVSGFARNGTEFLIYRFLFGLGVGGMFGSATTLVAESVPAHFRTAALGSMQALSAMGNMTASACSLAIVPGQENFWGRFSGWQVLFFVGVLPAVFAIPMALILKEPEPWRRAKAEAARGTAGKAVGSMADLFKHPRWRRSTLVGICLGVSGMVGLWGIAFFSPELITAAFKNRPLRPQEFVDSPAIYTALQNPPNPAVAHIKAKLPPAMTMTAPDNSRAGEQLTIAFNALIKGPNLYDEAAYAGLSLRKQTLKLVKLAQANRDPKDISFLNRQLLEQTFPGTILGLQKMIDQTRSRGTLLQDVGALLGMFGFTFIAGYFNRRTAFLSAFSLCLVSVAYVFYGLQTETDVYWMLPIMGFATLSVFAGYSIYFPELFPTRLRGTGVGFCYNTVRYLAAPFPLLLGWLSTLMPFRTVAVLMCSIYLVGIVALIWAPETKGKPLPED